MEFRCTRCDRAWTHEWRCCVSEWVVEVEKERVMAVLVGVLEARAVKLARG